MKTVSFEQMENVMGACRYACAVRKCLSMYVEPVHMVGCCRIYFCSSKFYGRRNGLCEINGTLLIFFNSVVFWD